MRTAERSLAAVAAGLVLAGGFLVETQRHAPVVEAISVHPLPLPNPMRHTVLAAGETAAHLIARLGAPAAEAADWLHAAGTMLNLRALPVGVVASATLDVHGNLRTVHLSPDWKADIILERHPGGIIARRQARPVERETIVVAGRIASSLFEAMDAAGESDDLAIALADLFAWDIDFHRDLRVDDCFAVLVERVRAEGRTVAYGPILAARFVNKGKVLTAARWAPAGAGAAYYDQAGTPMRKQFLKAPLRFSRLSSRFSISRLHPVLGVRLPHWGVDYAAPVGTPVMATADGTVTFVGRRGGAGNAVELRHAGGLSTSYFHLSRFAAGTRVGSRVEQGQVIGFVGSTGMSTGPHLDYRVNRAGRWVNPLGIGGEPGPPLPATEMTRFASWTKVALATLDAPGPLGADLIATLVTIGPPPRG